ncbi:MAG: TRAP transporter small permease [Marinisporobacter sp.]|jgi:TRAP-type C4-dicarboxylate transport system permease small subunit|nr:TRAP transporter small permease [Marinisporobacter sp.]
MRKKVLEALDKIEDTVLIIMFMGMVGIIFFQVIMRYVFNNSLTWSEELGKFLFVWLSWVGISIGHRRKEHIRITLLVDKLPYKLKQLAEALTELILIIICGITLYYGFIMIDIQMNVPYAGIKISTAWGYLSLVLGCGIFIIRAMAYFIEAIKNLMKNEIIS